MLALIAALALVPAPQGLAIGRGLFEITPDVPLPLGGYTERGSQLSVPGEHLYARTVFFQSGKTKIAVVSVETLTIPESLVREVKKRIAPDVFLFLAATHTHSAPDSQMLNDRMTFAIPGIASYEPKWLTWYADRIGKSVRLAMRHTQTASNVVIREGHADANVGRRKFAEPDQTATAVLATVGLSTWWSNELIDQYAAHGTVYSAKSMRLSGDWPGNLAQNTGALVLQGAIGDVLPKEMGKTPDESITKIVQRFEYAFMRNEGFKNPHYVWKPGGNVAVVAVPISLNTVAPHPTMAKTYGVPEMFANGIVKQFAPPKASITAFRIGKLAIVGVPGEPTSILGRQIKEAGRRMGFDSVLVCSHVNGWMGYILAPDDYDRGGYEATLSFYGREEGAKVVDAGIQALKALSTRP